MDSEHKESSRIELLTTDMEDFNDKPAVDEELAQVQQLISSRGDSSMEINLEDNGVQDHELPMMDVDHKLPTMDIEHEESSHIELLNEKSSVDEKLPEVEQLTVSQWESPTEIDLQDNHANDVFVPSAMHSEIAETSGSSEDQTEDLRSNGDDILLYWLKLNVALLAFGKLFSSLIGRRIHRTGSRRSFEPNEVISNNVVCKIRKEVSSNDGSSKKRLESAHFQEIGSSLGSAVGALFSEALLKTSNSGSPMPSDKMSMLLEGALKELTILVADDEGCSKLVADFSTSFRNIYSTMYRIQEACTSYEGSTGISTSHLQIKDDNLSKATCEKQCTSAKSNEETVHESRTDLSDDSWQVNPRVPPYSSRNIGKGKESQSVLAVDALSQCSNTSVSLADNEELNSGALATSNVEIHDSASGVTIELNSGALATSNVEIHDSASGVTIGKSVSISERPRVPDFVGNEDGLELTFSKYHASPAHKSASTHLDYEVEEASSVCEKHDLGLMTRSVDALALMAQSRATDDQEFKAGCLKIYERDVRTKELQNQIGIQKLRQNVILQSLEKEKVKLTVETNELMREKIDVDKSKANFEERAVMESQARAVHVSFSTMCADELAAGLLVMLATLGYSVHKYSYALLSDLVSTCQSSTKAPIRRSWGMHIDWLYNLLDPMSEKLQAFVCQVSVTGRISFGLVLVGLVASLLLRRSVTSSSQAMPATILVIVLGGICGLIGKISVDSLGGSGNQWWVVWGAFCVMHAFTNCFTPSVYRLLHGSPISQKARFGVPFWIRQITFHTTLVLILPVLAGVLPFGPFSLVMSDFFSAMAETLSSGISAVY